MRTPHDRPSRPGRCEFKNPDLEQCIEKEGHKDRRHRFAAPAPPGGEVCARQEQERLDAAEAALNGLLLWGQDGKPCLRGFGGVPQELTSSVKKRSHAALMRWRALRNAALKTLEGGE
jgi:hypothetical protein